MGAVPIDLAYLAAALGLDGLPDLPGARCSGKQPDWDEWLPHETPESREPRIARAIATCAGCPHAIPAASCATRYPAKRAVACGAASWW